MLAKGVEFRDTNNEIYTIQELLKNGGFGYVYLVQRTSDKKLFAVKVFPNALDMKEDYFPFLNEIEMAQKIVSTHVIKYEFVNDGKTFSDLPIYIIMEYAEKGSLDEEIKERKKKLEFFDEKELLQMYLELSYGMRDVNKYVVHRDIKPANILITSQGLKISDFGLSKYIGEVTRNITFKGYGTEPYCAPEVWNNEENNELMDIYSMGIVFYEMATLNYPYVINMNNYREAHLFSSIQPISRWNKNIPTGVSLMITRMLEKEKCKRYQSWDEIIDYLVNSIVQSKTDISNITEKAVTTQINYTIARQKHEASKKIIESKRNDIEKIVKLQLEQDIIEPLNYFITNNNVGYYKMQYDSCDYGDGGFGGIINLPNKKEIFIQIKILIDDEILRLKVREEAGVEVNWENVIPLFMNREIYAWGKIGVKLPMHVGYNLFFLKNKEDIYGEWFIANNLNIKNEPIRYEINSLKKETLNNNTAAFSKIEKYNLDSLIEFIGKCILPK